MVRVTSLKLLVNVFIGCCVLVYVYIYHFSYSAVQARKKMLKEQIAQLVLENVHIGLLGEDNKYKVSFGMGNDSIVQEFVILKEKPKHEYDYKYILIWTLNSTVPFVYWPPGRNGFIDKNCQYTNCFISSDKNYFSELTEWDALMFHIAEYTLTGNFYNHPSPEVRSTHQEYILASIESSHYYPICDEKWNNYFNWTMTYVLDSDVPWEYFAIRNLTDNQIIGPGVNVPWKENMNRLSEEKKQILKKKTKAVAWWVSNCYSPSRRELYAGELKTELETFGMVLDIFGDCGRNRCDEATCDKKLKDEYFFYLSFENSFAPDYTTEKFLNAMRNNAVPVVWGASDYSRYFIIQSPIFLKICVMLMYRKLLYFPKNN